MSNSRVSIERALVSVSDRTGLDDFGRTLTNAGVEIVSTGGTHEFLSGKGIPSIEVSEFTNSSEMLDGRVKTLHPLIHGGILADRTRHADEIARAGLRLIDLVCVNLYPFSDVSAASTDHDEIIENIDIGGVALLRAAAKNFKNVLALSDPSDYETIADLITENNRTIPLEVSREMADKAFGLTSEYDACVRSWLVSKEQESA